MKFTDRFFSVPVRVYDRWSMKQAEEEEEKLNLPKEASWTTGFLKIEHKEIYSWMDYFDSEQGVEDVEEGAGFLNTIVLMVDGTTFICPLAKKDFETRLNKYAEKWEQWWKEEEKQRQTEEAEFLKIIEKETNFDVL